MQQLEKTELQIIRLKDVMKRTGLSRSSIYALIGKDKFPESFKIGERAVGWYAHEVDVWVKARSGYKTCDRYDEK